MTRHLIIGAGEVGSSLYSYLLTQEAAVDLRDKAASKPELQDPPTVLHICFPYSPTFSEAVVNYVTQYQPLLTVIYTTVPVGTTKTLPAVHSPVEGSHPQLQAAFATFTRWIGFNTTSQFVLAQDYLAPLFPNVTLVYNSDKTELMKLLSTGYRYPAMIALAQEQERLCREYGFDYREIVTAYDQVYNQSYQALGRADVTRPLTTPGWIGGHCVMANLALLDQPTNPVVQWIKESNRKKAQDYS